MKDEAKNLILQYMWRLDDIIDNHGLKALTQAQREFWNNNLEIIAMYYFYKCTYWRDKSKIRIVKN